MRELREAQDRYSYQVGAVVRAGEPIPLELVRGNIRRILFNRRQSELIRSHEEELYAKAAAEGDFRIYEQNKTEK